MLSKTKDMKRYNITVLKTTLEKKLATEYGAEEIRPLPNIQGKASILCKLRQAR